MLERGNILEGMKSFYFYFLRFVKYEVGDGSKIRFWHNLWCGDQ